MNHLICENCKQENGVLYLPQGVEDDGGQFTKDKWSAWVYHWDHFFDGNKVGESILCTSCKRASEIEAIVFFGENRVELRMADHGK